MSKRTGIMLATMFTEKLFNKLPKPVIVQPKIEGDRMRVTVRNSVINMYSSMGNERISVPHIYEELKTTGWNDIELDGELYCHGMRHSDIRSIVSRTKNLHPDRKQIEYHIFDIVNGHAQGARLTNLNFKVFYMERQYTWLKYVPYIPVNSITELQEIYTRYLTEGYEGIIIRHPFAPYTRRKVSTLLKLKPRVSEFFEIIGVIEEKNLQGERKGTFGAFTCITSDGKIFSVGSGPTAYQRSLLWKWKNNLINQRIKIRFQGYTKIRCVPKLLSIDKEWLHALQLMIESATGGNLNNN